MKVHFVPGPVCRFSRRVECFNRKALLLSRCQFQHQFAKSGHGDLSPELHPRWRLGLRKRDLESELSSLLL
jgi:hypothetical protein